MKLVCGGFWPYISVSFKWSAWVFVGVMRASRLMASHKRFRAIWCLWSSLQVDGWDPQILNPDVPPDVQPLCFCRASRLGPATLEIKGLKAFGGRFRLRMFFFPSRLWIWLKTLSAKGFRPFYWLCSTFSAHGLRSGTARLDNCMAAVPQQGTLGRLSEVHKSFYVQMCWRNLGWSCVALWRASAQFGQDVTQFLSCSHFWTSEPWAGERLHHEYTSQGSPILYSSCLLHHMTLLFRSLCEQKEPSMQKINVVRAMYLWAG